MAGGGGVDYPRPRDLVTPVPKPDGGTIAVDMLQKVFHVRVGPGRLSRAALPLLFVACASSGDAELWPEPWPAPEPAPELGTVRWCRDLELGERHARSAGAPILLVFQEVPG